MGKLIILSAPSGAGKTTLCEMLVQALPNDTQVSISSTTRPPREGEKDGVNYEFISRMEFESRIRKGDFAEWAEVHGNLYGTSKSTIQKAFGMNRAVILDIDVQGAENLRQSFPGQCLSIFIAPPSIEELEKRLIQRGKDDPNTIKKRLENAQKEMNRSGEFDLVVVNNDLESAFKTILNEVKKALKV